MTLETYGYCMDCSERSSAFPDVERQIQNGHCATCGSEEIAAARTIPPTTWGQILDGRFLRGERFMGAA